MIADRRGSASASAEAARAHEGLGRDASTSSKAAVLEAPYTEAVDHRPPLTQMHELERTSLRIVVVVALLTKRVGNM